MFKTRLNFNLFIFVDPLFSILCLQIYFLLQMHVFKIAKFDSTDEIQGLIGRGCQQYNVMKKVACFAKFNTLAESWSEPVFLLINLPATDSLPSGTDKHHLMKTSTRKGKIIIVRDERRA